ncbi:hypothetical protein [Desulfovibrio inopinatus]|uniref:hypothetical protein n=1 Tax=Desulfovibrio inopinatus TaxID=102109 RepID=UPI000413C062|nr:hypothetical protein [Desulfovibrio inopinatus]
MSYRSILTRFSVGLAFAILCLTTHPALAFEVQNGDTKSYILQINEFEQVLGPGESTFVPCSKGCPVTLLDAETRRGLNHYKSTPADDEKLIIFIKDGRLLRK